MVFCPAVLTQIKQHMQLPMLSNTVNQLRPSCSSR